MGLLTNSINEIRQDVKKRFGNTNNYLVVIKKNKVSTGFFNLFIIGGLLYPLLSNRTLIVVFTPQGIYEKEISNSIKGDFVLIPWNEISDFSIQRGNINTIIKYTYLNKKIMYEVSYKGVPYKDNKENEDKLYNKDWNRVE